jgi:hypothetical protein
MNAVARHLSLTFAIALACSAAHAQALATYGDAPAAEAEGAAAAANRAGNGGGGPLTAGANDAQLLGGPATYGDAYQARTVLDQQQQNVPAAAANAAAQGGGATPVEHMLTNPGTPQQGGPVMTGTAKKGGNAGNARSNYAAGAQPQTPANAALRLNGNGAAAGAPRQQIYKSPW